MHAYAHHRIFIKKGSRVCDCHYDENRLIRNEEFHVIETVDRIQNSDIINRLAIECLLAAQNSILFSDFKEFKYCSNQHCLKITGWEKEAFTHFSQHIYKARE
jgi:hypothetical protein